MNHPNRSNRHNNRAANPTPRQITAAREAVQNRLGLNIGDGQIACATLLFTTDRVWRQWESGDRRMHPAFWRLFELTKDEARAP